MGPLTAYAAFFAQVLKNATGKYMSTAMQPRGRSAYRGVCFHKPEKLARRTPIICDGSSVSAGHSIRQVVERRVQAQDVSRPRL